MANNRIYYPGQGLAIKANGGALTWTTGHLVHGAQSASITTNFNLTPVRELGTITTYENVEGIPDVEFSATKVLDGWPLMWHLSTTAATSPTLAGRSAARCDIGLAIYPETNDNASGTPISLVALSGMYANSLSYTFNADASPFTEEVTWVGNDKVWTLTPGVASGTPGYGEDDVNYAGLPTLTWSAHMARNDAPYATQGVQQTQDMKFDLPAGPLTGDTNGSVNHADVTVLPQEVQGVTTSGLKGSDTHVDSVRVSTSFNRENINELGRRGPYSRYINFPVDVTTEISLTSSSGDLVTATTDGFLGTGAGTCNAGGTNVRNRTIRFATCDGTRIYLGTKNKLLSANYGGGDAGGGNVQVSYTYTNQNDFTVVQMNDPHASGSAWWTLRNALTYLKE